MMRTGQNKVRQLGLAAVFFVALTCTGQAQEGIPEQGYTAPKGKRVVYILIAMNYNLTQAWFAGMKREADRFGYHIGIRDPNWDADAAVQAFQAAIHEKPDLIVTLPTDTTSISRLVTKAPQDAIPVIEVQQITSTAPDIYIGADYLSIGRSNAKAVLKACGKGSGKSGSVAIITGVVTAPGAISWEQGVRRVFATREDIKVSSTQAPNWDASESHAIAATALQQYPDLCAILDVWDGQASGSAAAVREAGKTGSVYLATAGGGEQSACDAIAKGAFSSYVDLDAAAQTRYLNALIAPSSCWTLQEMESSGG